MLPLPSLAPQNTTYKSKYNTVNRKPWSKIPVHTNTVQSKLTNLFNLSAKARLFLPTPPLCSAITKSHSYSLFLVTRSRSSPRKLSGGKVVFFNFLWKFRGEKKMLISNHLVISAWGAKQTSKCQSRMHFPSEFHNSLYADRRGSVYEWEMKSFSTFIFLIFFINEGLLPGKSTSGSMLCALCSIV